MANSARAYVDEILSHKMTREIWSGNYDKVLPVSVQIFELSSILPAVFYMFRFGQRRGGGNFLKTFADKVGTPSQRRRSANIDRIAETLSGATELDGFKDEAEKAILGDLLLCFCLENIRHSLGRDQQIQRVAPAHYMASWIDLPESVAHLRFVPEMIVAMLADQKGETVQPTDGKKRTWFPVGKRYEENILLSAFSQGVVLRGEIRSDVASDKFNEADDLVGLDQLLMIRLAQQLEAAPDKIRGKEAGPISNQRPIAKRAAENFSDDIRRFTRAYAAPVPRYALVDMMESCIAIGLTTILTSTIELLFRWSDMGEVSEEQEPAPLFVDCSNGVERHIRDVAEQSMDDAMRRMERFPVILMVLRLLDYHARDNREIKKQNIPTRPYATAWLNLLGDLLHDRDRHQQARRIRERIEDDADKLADELADDYPEAAEILDNADDNHPVWRLADSLMVLMGPNPRKHFMDMLDSGLLTGRPNGLAVKRSTTRGLGGSTKRRKRDVRSLVFTDSVLDYLVHLHLLKSGNKQGVRPLSFRDFLEVLRERYGFHVDTAPPGMTISNELLQRNRTILERRLRDLGLLVGVNDAEAMKRLEPRFEPAMEN